MVKKFSLSQIWSINKKNNANSISQDILSSIKIKNHYLNNFDWEKYLEQYPDLNELIDDINEQTLYKHWITIGKNENRCAGKVNSQEPFEIFNHESYLNNNPDLIELDDHFKLYEHWCNNGITENRIVTTIETISNPSDTVEEIEIIDDIDIFEDKNANDLWIDTLYRLKNEFDWKFYLQFYKVELIPAGIITHSQSFIHWLMHGHEEKRLGKNMDRFIKKQIQANEKKELLNNEQQQTNKENDTPADKQPADKQPTDKQPTDKQPTDKQPADKQPADKQPVTESFENVDAIPIYVINLKERIDKKIEIIHQMNKLGISDYNFFEAWDKTKPIVTSKYKEYIDGYDKGTIKRTIFESNWKSKVIKSIGAIGLIVSTIELFKEIEKKGLDKVIILEDDVQLHKSWNYMLRSIKSVLNDKEILYIGYNNHKKHINELLVGCNSTLAKVIPEDRSLYAFYGTFGYICSSSFRKKIINLGIDWFITNNATIDYGYNILNWTKQITQYVATGEPLVFPDVFDPECINNKRENKEQFYLDRFIKCENYIAKPETDISFVFIVPSYNNEEWIERNMNSMISQTYRNWRLIYINDNSDDKTHAKYNELSKPICNKSVYIHNDKKYGQAFNRYRAYNMCEDNEYCILLDGDDWLSNKYVLQYLSIFIPMYDLDLTYGKFLWYMDNTIQNFNFPKDYSEKTIADISYRKDSWRAMHLRVIKAQHLKFVNPLDFLQDNGDFIICCTDLVESFAGLELCKGRHKMTDETLMIYNKANSVNYTTSHYSDVDKELKLAIQKTVRSRTPYLSNIRKDSVIIVDIEEDNYKKMIEKYKKDFVNKADLFLVIGNEIHFYINKLNSYNNIQYMT